MPADLQGIINSMDENDKKVTKICFIFLLISHSFIFINFQHEMIWITCEGENPADIENLGPINYIPQRGFPGYFYPFMNQKGYMPPVIAINFERPKSNYLTNHFLTYLALIDCTISASFSRRVDQHWVQSLGSKHQSRSYRSKRLRSLWTDGRLNGDNEFTSVACATIGSLKRGAINWIDWELNWWMRKPRF